MKKQDNQSTASDSDLSVSSGYVCAQCGPDANGSHIHSMTHHELPLKTAEEALETLAELWHESEIDKGFHPYIGWTWDQYTSWLESGNLPSHNSKD